MGTGSLLDYRFQRRAELQARRGNIIPFLKGIVGSFESLVEQKQLDLVFLAGEEEEIVLYFDPEKLEKVVVNLVANGMDAEEIVDAYPYLEPEDIRQALHYAAWRAEDTVYTVEPASA